MTTSITSIIREVKSTKLVFTPAECEVFFESSPEQLAELDDTGMYKVDSNGNLVVKFTEEELYVFRGSLLKHISMFRKQGVVYSVDYTTITVDWNKRNDYINYYELYGYSYLAEWECAFYQILKGADPSEVSITTVYIDYETGEIIGEKVWPYL